MRRFHCGVLPYISVREAFEFGETVVWPNVESEWHSRADHNHTSLTQMYRDSKGRPRGEKASVISFREVDRDDMAVLQDHVIALSTVDWLEHGRRSADPWIVDLWNLPNDDSALGFYVRRGKFTAAFTRSEHDLVYPPPLTSERRFVRPRSMIADFLEAEMAIPREDSLLRTLTYLHRARFQLPFYSTPGEDVETLWSALESLLRLPTASVFDDRPSWAAILLAKLGVRTRTSLRRRRTPKDELLTEAVFNEFGGEEALSDRCAARFRDWAAKFYKTRNRYTHGAGVKVEDLFLHDIGMDQFHIALAVAEAVLTHRMDPSTTSRVVLHIEATFRWKETFDNLIGRLVNSDRQDWYPNCSLAEVELIGFRKLLEDVARHRTPAVGRANSVRVRKAAHKMGLVLSAWIKVLVDSSPLGIDLHPVAGVWDLISKLSDAGKKDHVISGSVSGELRYTGADNPESYGVDSLNPPVELLLGGVIPLWEWVGAYIDLNDIA